MRILAALVLFSSLPLWAEPLSQGDRDRILSYFHGTRKQLLDVAAPLSDTQWNFKPAPDRWSVGEVVEHLALTEPMLFGLAQKIAQSPAGEKPATPVKDEVVLKGIADRSKKAQAPEQLVPKRQWPTKDATVQAFRERRDQTLNYLRTTQDPLRERFRKNPTLGELDAYQWMLLITAHTERHLAQAKEVMADPNFPKR